MSKLYIPSITMLLPISSEANLIVISSDSYSVGKKSCGSNIKLSAIPLCPIANHHNPSVTSSYRYLNLNLLLGLLHFLSLCSEPFTASRIFVLNS